MPEHDPTSGIVFLTIDDVRALHRDTLEVEGGADGVIDAGRIEAAIAMPMQRYGGALLHAGLIEMAAAYLFHVCQAHAFRDGNKRVATLSCTIFLRLNGVPVPAMPDPEGFEQTVLKIASGAMSKADATDWLREHVDPT
ncbi:MAG: type II toxin-antitoxin system death-on-curing family toxin [Planctomycetota bacterium]